MSIFPPTWIEAEIGELCDLINGRAFKPTEWSQSGLPIVRIQNLNNPDKPFNRFDGEVRDRFLIDSGDLLFAWSGTPGTSFGAHVWTGGPAVLNQHIFNVKFDRENLDRDFFRHAINQKLSELIGKAHGGVGLRHVTKSQFEETKVSLPPLREQQRIVRKLDTLHARTNTARARLNAIANLVVKYKAEVLTLGIQGQLTNDWRVKNGIGVGQPERLEKHSLDVRYGSSAKSSKTGEIPVLRMGNIQSMELTWTNLVYSDRPDEIEKYRLEPGDVLFNRTNSPELVGKTAIYRGEQPAIYAGYLIRVKCAETLLPEYLNYALNSSVGRAYCWRVKSDSVSQSNINAQKLKAFEFLVPPIDEQQQIIDRIHGAFSKIDRLAAEAENARKLSDRLDQRVLEKAFSGGLVAQDPNDEPASELFGRIRKKRASRSKQTKRISKGTKTVKTGTAKADEMNEKKRSQVSESHLSELLIQLGGTSPVRDLWLKSEMDLNEFYKLLRDEVSAGRINETTDKRKLVATNAA
ncbi:restriction endonuclease subunit S [Sulfitobacter sp. G21635-S1]|uniref:restriction endonuclease subunit S n=1 Tax=Sulfitobacter sp. G21635-S1 TaxID=3014043 RepID=UPI0022B045DA|nr:restriction endonuclease subunit S [Sulfitobacter sp. G21635-S1]MCZ4258844.1 restriction endonuclease subunit S [Sulfitobacter sp. G21635-S1]